jgi:hypothetical protein
MDVRQKDTDQTITKHGEKENEHVEEKTKSMRTRLSERHWED